MRAVRLALEEEREKGSELIQDATKAAFEKQLDVFYARLIHLAEDYAPERLL